MRGITLNSRRRERLQNLLDEKTRAKVRVQRFCIVCAAVALIALCLIPFVPDDAPPIPPPCAIPSVPADMRDCPLCHQRATRSALAFRCANGHRFETPDVILPAEAEPSEFEKLTEH